MKYFSEASLEKIFFLLFIRGIIDNRLISNPIHIPMVEYEEIVMRVPRIIVKKIIIDKI